jgi:RNA polymerase sigma-70 factor (ECF subfamily)
LEKGEYRLDQEQITIERAQKGDREAFRQLVETHQRMVYHLARNLTGNHHDAEDLTQEVFIQVYRNIHRFRGDSKFSSWIYRIAVNSHISRTRKKSWKTLVFKENLEDQAIKQNPASQARYANPEKAAEAGLLQGHIQRAVEQLSPRERSVFVLRHYEDMPLNEIARTLNIHTGTVKSSLFRALQKLQKSLSFYQNDFQTETSP